MKIEHTALYVQDLDAAKDFFVTYFGGTAGDIYHNPKTDFRSYFIRFDGGARLELMHKPGLAPHAEPNTATGYAHIAFSVGSEEAVNTLTERLRADGYPVYSGPRVTGDGYYESCIIAVDGNLVEITP